MVADEGSELLSLLVTNSVRLGYHGERVSDEGVLIEVTEYNVSVQLLLDE
jgi:hypothetical protein